MDATSLIDTRAGVRSGKPCFIGTRIAVYDVLEYLASGMSTQEIVGDFPELTEQHIRAALEFAAVRERRLVALVGSAFPGGRHVIGYGLDAATDREIWDHAAAHGYVVVSKDSDFRQLAFLHGPPPKAIWPQAGNASTGTILDLLLRHRGTIEEFESDAEGALLVLSLA